MLLRLGALVALTESAGSLARRAARAVQGGLLDGGAPADSLRWGGAPLTALPDKADRRIDGETLSAISRVHARRVALRVASEGVQLAAAAEEPGWDGGDELGRQAGLTAALAAQAGLLGDLDRVADALYQRS